MVWLSRLSHDGAGIKNSEPANALSLSKPSVHSMLKFLSEAGIVRQEIFGLACLTEEGRSLAKQYEVCFYLVEKRWLNCVEEAQSPRMPFAQSLRI